MPDTITEGRYTIEILPDDCPDSPREWDNLGTMICFHKRYNLGDVHDYHHGDYNGWDELEEAIRAEEDAVLVLPLYLYDHSGLRMKVGSFEGLLPQGHARFDSGRVGFIVARRADVRQEIGDPKKQETLEKVEKILRGEVETYDQYLIGDVWGYKITDPQGEETDSCWGFYGRDECEKEARGMLRAQQEADKKATL